MPTGAVKSAEVWSTEDPGLYPMRPVLLLRGQP